MLPAGYIAAQTTERQELLTSIHDIIMAGDTTITPVVEPMMGKDMIIYKDRGMMKYALASVQKYMSLHVLPMYMVPAIHDKYKALLTKAAFQKGCVNFSGAEEMPLGIVKKLIGDCAVIDLHQVRNDQLQAKKTAKKK